MGDLTHQSFISLICFTNNFVFYFCLFITTFFLFSYFNLHVVPVVFSIEPSLIHQPLACTDKNELLNTLNNMPSLLQTTIKQGALLEPNINNKRNATQLFPPLSTKSFESIRPKIPKNGSLLKNDSNSSVVIGSNSCSLDLNNGHSFSSNNENCRSGSWLRKYPTDNGANIIDTVSFITLYGLIFSV